MRDFDLRESDAPAMRDRFEAANEFLGILGVERHPVHRQYTITRVENEFRAFWVGYLVAKRENDDA